VKHSIALEEGKQTLQLCAVVPMNTWSSPALIEGLWCNLQRIGVGDDVPDFADHFESELNSAGFEAVDPGPFGLPVFLGGRWVLGEAEIERAAGEAPI
jgi:hypothetical protein